MRSFFLNEPKQGNMSEFNLNMLLCNCNLCIEYAKLIEVINSLDHPDLSSLDT